MAGKEIRDSTSLASDTVDYTLTTENPLMDKILYWTINSEEEFTATVYTEPLTLDKALNAPDSDK